ncbi:NAD(P)H-quinone oxidoreductase subunit 3 [Candidatus Annandia adelgestsuga]|uniref:NADH-quinone oxidoreductase subunit A n=1 Tax=Candidatus Annandia adelgestsuga TaxID=1302411 RepID=A0A3S9J7R7_9ENTR|nr:NADH-quinone oxidoreductase subunit A [Candidatus Annandia adelgestsuga]AZP36330.1 NAD(P)H-quinone oxidoreductase subunit 3 [Candidatus Annandia adelgestsuga]
MLNQTNILSENVFFFIFILFSLFICFFMLLCGWLLGNRCITKNRNLPFESGIDSVGNTKINLSIKFYILAMLFVIFDTESIFLYIWSISIKENGWLGFIEILYFVFILVIGLIYLINMKLLNWNKTLKLYKIND